MYERSAGFALGFLHQRKDSDAISTARSPNDLPEFVFNMCVIPILMKGTSVFRDQKSNF